MRRLHSMPFGAQVLDDGQVRFRLWAPAAREVDVCLEHKGKSTELPMSAAGDGWFALDTAAAGAGSRYRYRVDGGMKVPDPASRFNPDDVHEASEVINAAQFAWQDTDWRGRAWEDAVIYELHVGTFSPEGNYEGVIRRLDYLKDLGVTAIELMPLADFPGSHNWGYDGVLLFAPDSSYGRPEDLKQLVQAAHARGLMVFLDVVYNHFGPDGNYLHVYAQKFFTDRHHTPWGAAINFDGPGSSVVRDFYIHNALYWLEEFHFDGLRLDAVHAICDDSDPDILTELAQAVRAGPGLERQIHLVLENDDNAARYLTRAGANKPLPWYTAQWNDDIHHVLHVIATSERDGYYEDYVADPLAQLGRCLTEGFAYQGEESLHRGGAKRGEISRNLPQTAFVNFLQNHDQVGNRAFGERLAHLATPQALRALVAVALLAPSPPLLFMGEEFGAAQPFLFFCDFGPELAAAVRDGRRGEFARFARFSDPAVRERIPDPNDVATFNASRLDWRALTQPDHDAWLKHYRRLLTLRREELAPRLRGMPGGQASWQRSGDRVLAVKWRLGDGSDLALAANLSVVAASGVQRPAGRLIYHSEALAPDKLDHGELPPWSVAWLLSGDAAGVAS